MTMNLDDAWPLLAKAAAVGDHASKEDVEKGIENGSFMLFSREESAALVMRCNGYLRIGMAGGNMAEMLDMELEITEYAKHSGCRFVEIVGRPGWERALEGYKRVAVVLRKEL